MVEKCITLTHKIITIIKKDIFMTADKEVENNFLNKLKDNETSVTVFLVNGVKLQGIITWFDDATILLRRDGHTQLIYKHAVSTIMPGDAVEI